MGEEIEEIKETKEIMELTHEPVPGYRKIFLIVIAVGALYLGIIFLNTL